MKKVLKLKEVLAIGGRISGYKNGSTNSISLSKLLKKEGLVFDNDIQLCYLVYTQTPTIQAVYQIANPKDENSELIELYNKLNEI